VAGLGSFWQGGPDALVLLLGLVGLAWGVAADRIAARWPAHEDGSVRGFDWRTLVVAFFGTVVLAALTVRFGDVDERLLFGVYFAALVLLMATDLDQKLLPDAVTLPLIVLGGFALVWGGDTLVSRSPAWMAVVGAVVVPALLYASSLPFGEGALGGGDVKFMVSVGLMTGLIRTVLSLFAGAMLGGVVIFALLISRRITLKSFVPFGPFLIAGAAWAALLPASS
jgi:prepilin signal peptidase PulO-like enzyme (type II secretory pathway)